MTKPLGNLGVTLTLMAQLVSASGNTVETYETEKGTVTFRQCNPPIKHRSKMLDENLEWHFQPYEQGRKFAISATYPTQINKVPLADIFLVIEEKGFYKIPIKTDFALILEPDGYDHPGTFRFYSDKQSIEHVQIEFHYKVQLECADNLYIYTAKPHAP